jgi:hypothetical protein
MLLASANNQRLMGSDYSHREYGYGCKFSVFFSNASRHEDQNIFNIVKVETYNYN